MQNRMLSSADYLKALAEKETRENARNQARRDIALAKAKLKNLTGLDALPELEPVSDAEQEAFIAKSASLDDSGLDKFYALLWERAQAKNPAIARALLSSQTAETNIKLAKRDYFPLASASLSLGNIGFSSQNGFKVSGVGDLGINGKFSLSGSVPLDFPITASNVAKKKIALEQAVLDLKTAGDSLSLETQSAVLNLASQAGTFLSAKRSCEYAKKHFDYVQELYNLSRNSQSELSDALALLQTNRTQLIKARYGFLSSLSKIRSLGAFENETEIAALIAKAGEEAR
jgi:outer membrane protein TolC